MCLSEADHPMFVLLQETVIPNKEDSGSFLPTLIEMWHISNLLP